jgi:hypothetical protein
LSTSRDTYKARVADNFDTKDHWQGDQLTDQLKEYYTEHIEPAINYIARYYLEELGVTDPQELRTNNQAVNLNLTRRKKGEWWGEGKKR